MRVCQALPRVQIDRRTELLVAPSSSSVIFSSNTERGLIVE